MPRTQFNAVCVFITAGPNFWNTNGRLRFSGLWTLENVFCRTAVIHRGHKPIQGDDCCPRRMSEVSLQALSYPEPFRVEICKREQHI
jgi:hypothetical protein